jgi:hypothetical protein
LAAALQCRKHHRPAPRRVASTGPIKPKAHDTPATIMIDTQKKLARIVATAKRVRVGLEQTRPLFPAVEGYVWRRRLFGRHNQGVKH